MNWILEALLASALLIAAILVIRRPVARLFGPHAAYLLWAAPALRLLLPPLPAGAVAPTLAPVHGALPASGLELLGGAAALPQAVAAPAVDWTLAVLLVWLAGAAAHLTWHVVGYQRFIRGALGAQAPLHTLDEIAVHAADVAGPAAAGILRRRILLPHDFADRFAPHERRLALEHEIAHHRRGDLVANWIALGVLSLHWFNPLAHVAYRAFRADQELACDATVLAGAAAADRHAYASAVVKAAWRRSPVAACPMNSADQLKARLAMMNAPGLGLPRQAAGLAAICALACVSLAATASRTIAALPTAQAAQSASPAAHTALPSLGDALSPRGRAAPAGLVDHPAPRPTAQPAVAVRAPAPEEDVAATAVALAALNETPFTTPAGRPAPPATAPAAVAPAAPIDERPGVTPIAATTTGATVTFPSERVIRAAAVEARNQLKLRGDTLFREVRAVMVDGRYNAADPGQAYVGFCGQLRVEGGSDWLPFFVSATPSQASGAAAKCSGPRSAENYTGVFLGSTPRRVARRTPAAPACTADQSPCALPEPARFLLSTTSPIIPGRDEPRRYEADAPLGQTP